MQHPMSSGHLGGPHAHAAWVPRTVAVLCLLVLTGCFQEHDVNSVYGRRHGNGRRSVNGTAALSNMFEQAGFEVSSWRRLSPKLESEQTIVWAPDTFAAPSQEVVDYFNEWLDAEPGRTLVVIGRDYDAAIAYWRQILSQAPPEQRLEIRRKLAQLKSAHAAARAESWASRQCDWFEFDLEKPARDVDSVEGTWKFEVDAGALDFSHTTRLVLPDGQDVNWESEVLLASNEEPLVVRLRRRYANRGQLIVVANGAWLLNHPLVHPEHRVLASLLIEECQPSDRVCFLESGPEGIRISESDNVLPLTFRMFTVFPINIVLLHLVVLGIVYCFAILPIFGRPRELPPDRVSDFGKHVTAVGDLLERGGDRDFARDRIEAYHEMMQTKGAKE